MPILGEEPDMFPGTLLEATELEDGFSWWAFYTLSRQEKQLMRKLRDREIAHYSPVIAKRYKSPAGRVRTSHIPLFSNYVFVLGTEDHRYHAVSTGCVSNCIEVTEPEELVADLRQIHRLINTGQPLAPEERLVAGDLVRVKSGPFAGFEGRISQRAGQSHLIVEVRFMNQGASAALDDCEVELVQKAEVAE